MIDRSSPLLTSIRIISLLGQTRLVLVVLMWTLLTMNVPLPGDHSLSAYWEVFGHAAIGLLIAYCVWQYDPIDMLEKSRDR